MADCYTEQEKAVVVLVENFYKYMSKNKISKSSFREMLQHELDHMLTNTRSRKAADDRMQKLDKNQDGCLDFEEYWSFIKDITRPIANFIREQEQQSSS